MPENGIREIISVFPATVQVNLTGFTEFLPSAPAGRGM
jgi:hypothetical protein